MRKVEYLCTANSLILLYASLTAAVYKLIERNHHGIVLTDAGSTFYAVVQKLVTDDEKAVF